MQRIDVVAGVLADAAGRVLLAQRPPGSHLAGSWEFPGGKREPGEHRRAALARELREELAIELTRSEPLIRYRHRYPDREVILDVFRVQRYRGEPTGAEGQALRWVKPADLNDSGLLAADRPIVAALRLPHRYAITAADCSDPVSMADAVAAMTARGIRLIQLRVPSLGADELGRLAATAVAAAPAASVLIGGDPVVATAVARATGAAGIHVPARFLRAMPVPFRPKGQIFGASCHDAGELGAAAAAGADFAVLGPVLATPSHPHAKPLGWRTFARLVAGAGLPVYALGGVGERDLRRARRLGAQGVAGIRGFWPDGSG